MNRLKDIESMAQGHAGALAGLLSTLFLYPLENIKTRMHIQAGKSNHQTITKLITEILQKEGIQGFYKGVSALAIGNYISYGVYFFFYEYCKHIFHSNLSNPIDLIKPSLASAIITSLITNPFWVVQSYMTEQTDNKNFFQKTQLIVQTEGFPALFKGLQASLILTINPIIQFFIYEVIKKKFVYSNHQDLVNFLGGAISKAIATVITYPYQLLRTKCHLGKAKATYIQLIKQILQKEGIQGLFSGLSPKLIQSVLNSAILLTLQERIYEMIKSFIIIVIINLLKYQKKIRQLQKGQKLLKLQQQSLQL